MHKFKNVALLFIVIATAFAFTWGDTLKEIQTDIATWGEVATPSTPINGQHRMYFKADNKLYTLDDTGSEVEVGSGAGVPLMSKGSLLTSDGASNGEFTACTDGQIIEWDSAEVNGFKCATAGGTGADRDLNNLQSPVLVNADLDPATPLARDIGYNTSPWRDLYLRTIDFHKLNDLGVPTGQIGTNHFAGNQVQFLVNDDGLLVKSNTSGGVSGEIELFTGDTTFGTSNTGHITLRTGLPDTGNSGAVTVESGDVNGAAGVSGTVNVESGDSSTFISGPLNLRTGAAPSSSSGSVQIKSGDCGGGNCGAVTMSTGQNSLSGGSGFINIVTGPTVATAGNTGTVNLASGSTLATGSLSGTVTVTSGSARSARSGDVSILSGSLSDPANISDSGDVLVSSGVKTGNTNGNSGAVTIKSGNGDFGGGTNSSGIVSIESGRTQNGVSGQAIFSSGISVGTGNTGNVTVTSGEPTSGQSGTTSIKTGNVSGTTNSGAVSIESGNQLGVSGNSGPISLVTGTADNGERGFISLDTEQDRARIIVQPSGTVDNAIATVKYVDDQFNYAFSVDDPISEDTENTTSTFPQFDTVFTTNGSTNPVEITLTGDILAQSIVGGGVEDNVIIGCRLKVRRDAGLIITRACDFRGRTDATGNSSVSCDAGNHIDATAAASTTYTYKVEITNTNTPTIAETFKSCSWQTGSGGKIAIKVSQEP